MINKTPKILIIGETFHHKSGGGITLCNLFKDWPKENLINAGDQYILNNLDYNKCIYYYQFGNKENKYFLPWNIRKYIPHPILRNNSESGSIDFKIKENNKIKGNSKLMQLLKKLLISISYIFGVYPILCKKGVSKEFIDWVYKHNPDYIYTQLSDISSIRFTRELIDKTNISLAIHIMDDWPSTYSKSGLLYYYWKKRIDIEFRELIKLSSICLSISEGMSEEYKRRYNREFIPFHNPIDLDFWGKNIKSNFRINQDDIRVLYSGRIGLGIEESLLDVIIVVDEMRKNGVKITLELQVPEKNHNLFYKYIKNGTIVYNPVVEYQEIPRIFSNADILILPYDFSSNGLKFIKYSMPTKASEFMMSGTPILLYCSEDVYLGKHAKKYEWAHLVSTKNRAILKTNLITLIQNQELRISYSKKALNFARNNFNSTKVRAEFLSVFNTSLKK